MQQARGPKAFIPDFDLHDAPMLPESLWCLVSAALVVAQSRQQLLLDRLRPSDDSLVFTVPASDNLTISVALCATGTSPRFFVTNVSSSEVDPGPSGGTDVYEIELNDGYGSFNGPFANGGVLAVSDGADVAYEVGVSENGPMHEILPEMPFFGDSSGNQAIIFSPPVASWSAEIPTYPNYTLPPANLSVPAAPSISSNFSIILSRTTSSMLTGCALKSQTSTGTVADQRLWLKDEDGWRSQWTIEGLSPSTNYTAYAVIADSKVSGPLYFRTKSASFSCPLISQLPYCPSIAYAVPLPQPSNPFTMYNASNLPLAISGPLLSSLTNFTTTLTTYACGRDDYSPLVSCNDCQREYRRWLCTVSFPRCAEDTSSSSSSDDSAQKVFSALSSQPTSAQPRNPTFPPYTETYTVLQPCIERCTAVDRACPAFLGIKCPVPRFNAASSYGVGYIDNGEDGIEGEGLTGVAQDAYGNVWCNLG
ncbi:stretch-activated cation channel Mid1 [Mucidula mucida]|nr:stretch-activated cation channel Mid1 [Mucidula mucida]